MHSYFPCLEHRCQLASLTQAEEQPPALTFKIRSLTCRWGIKGGTHHSMEKVIEALAFIPFLYFIFTAVKMDRPRSETKSTLFSFPLFQISLQMSALIFS